MLIGGAAVAWPQAMHAQQHARVPRIGFLHTPSLVSREGQALREAFWQGMRALDWVGHNIFVEYRSARETSTVSQMAAELARLEVDLIVAGPAAAARAARAQTTTIPIVCPTLADPVGEGPIASLARPGGKLTGVNAGVILHRRPEQYSISLERKKAPASGGLLAFARHFSEVSSGGVSGLGRRARRLEWASR